MHDDEIPKSIPIAAVPPSAAPMDHQKPLFDGGRATALTMAPESHRQNSRRDLCKTATLFIHIPDKIRIAMVSLINYS